MRYSFVAILAASASAAPLNINLGAFSPTVLVGDGEISFGANQGVEGLMSTLQGAGAASNGAVAQGQAIAPVAPAGEGIQQASVITEPVRSRSLGVTKDLEARQAEGDEDEDKDDHFNVEAEAEAEAADIEARQEDAPQGGLVKRQSGFDRALTFAEAALQKGPKIQLGTPAAGVGIIVDNNQQAAAVVTAAE